MTVLIISVIVAAWLIWGSSVICVRNRKEFMSDTTLGDTPLGNQPDRMHRGAIAGRDIDLRQVLDDAEHLQAVMDHYGRPVATRHQLGRQVLKTSEIAPSEEE